MNWLKQAQERQDELIKELQELVQIESVLDETTITAEAPFGEGPLKAMEWLLQKGEEQGLTAKISIIWQDILKWDKVKS